ncbi:hypothetical protein AB0C21_14915 [Spirillospora sp. NPDC049024]
MAAKVKSFAEIPSAASGTSTAGRARRGPGTSWEQIDAAELERHRYVAANGKRRSPLVLWRIVR